MDKDKNVDESWKDQVAKEKDGGSCGEGCDCSSASSCGDDCGHDHGKDEGDIEVNFFNYIASMGYQSMIFLGEVPNPMTGQTEQNLRQAKFLIDTIALVREKTKGNLSEQEEAFLGGTLYELQMKYVELSPKDKGTSGASPIIL